MGKGTTLLAGLGLGAGWMYLFDPEQGRRRRALLADQATSLVNDANDWLDKAWRDLEHRAEGQLAEITSMFAPAREEVPDELLVRRVRAKLGHYTSHPRSIEVAAHDGRVTLEGPILADELQPVVSAVSSVRGVKHVENRLEAHSTGDISALQGGRRPGGTIGLMEANWAPATRLLAGATGGLLMLNCMSRRTLGSMLTGTVGMGLFLRAASNQEFRGMMQVGGGRLAGSRQDFLQSQGAVGPRDVAEAAGNTP